MDDDAVVEVYWAADAPRAHLVKTVLLKAGIEAHVVGEMLQAAVGELPWGPATSPRVWVAKRDEAQARTVIAEWERRRHDDRAAERAPWTCPVCGEEVEGDFDICWKCQTPRVPATDGERAEAHIPDARDHPDRVLRAILREGGGRPVRTFVLVSLACTVVLVVGTRYWGPTAGVWSGIVIGVILAAWLRRGR